MLPVLCMFARPSRPPSSLCPPSRRQCSQRSIGKHPRSTITHSRTQLLSPCRLDTAADESILKQKPACEDRPCGSLPWKHLDAPSFRGRSNAWDACQSRSHVVRCFLTEFTLYTVHGWGIWCILKSRRLGSLAGQMVHLRLRATLLLSSQCPQFVLSP